MLASINSCWATSLSLLSGLVPIRHFLLSDKIRKYLKMRPVSLLTVAFAAFTGVEAFHVGFPEHRGLVMVSRHPAHNHTLRRCTRNEAKVGY